MITAGGLSALSYKIVIITAMGDGILIAVLN